MVTWWLVPQGSLGDLTGHTAAQAPLGPSGIWTVTALGCGTSSKSCPRPLSPCLQSDENPPPPGLLCALWRAHPSSKGLPPLSAGHCSPSTVTNETKAQRGEVPPLVRGSQNLNPSLMLKPVRLTLNRHGRWTSRGCTQGSPQAPLPSP